MKATKGVCVCECAQCSFQTVEHTCVRSTEDEVPASCDFCCHRVFTAATAQECEVFSCEFEQPISFFTLANCLEVGGTGRTGAVRLM